jgi:hypothetical protein
MRTNVNLDADVYDLAYAYADGKGITLGAAISELVRQAGQITEPGALSQKLKMNEYGYYEIVGGDVLTSERVKELSEGEVV